MKFIKKFLFEYIIQILLIITFVMGIKAFVEKNEYKKQLSQLRIDLDELSQNIDTVFCDTIRERDVWKKEYANVNMNISMTVSQIKGYKQTVDELNDKEENNEYIKAKCLYLLDSLENKVLPELINKRDKLSKDNREKSNKIDHIEIRIITKM